MVSFYNTYGKISMNTDYFAGLAASAVQSCYGVAGMSTGGTADSLKSIVRKDFPEKGIRVDEVNGELVIELHIVVVFGLNIAAAVKSVTHKLKYTVEEATGLTVRRIRVFVDDIAT